MVKLTFFELVSAVERQNDDGSGFLEMVWNVWDDREKRSKPQVLRKTWQKPAFRFTGFQPAGKDQR